MRSRTSNAKSRLRSGGYKCNLCGRRVIDAATLERHQKTVHNLPSKGKKVGFKAKASVQKAKSNNAVKAKAVEDLVKDELLVEAKPKPKIKNEEVRVRMQEEILAVSPTEKKNDVAAKNGDRTKTENAEGDTKAKNNSKTRNGKRRVEFECPVCEKTFNIYFTAHRHIQNFHPINAEGKKVPPNSLELVQPIRVEQCVKCTAKIRSTEIHVCKRGPEDSVEIASQYICTGCYQSFISLKTFDMHVAGLHSDGVDSMFFPTEEEFNNWRMDMERQTNIKYSVLGEYDSKKIYRCNYARENDLNDISTSHFCPSTMVVQDFSKGIQVHFYKKHYGHQAQAYMLANKYNKYSITTFLKNPDVGCIPVKSKQEKDSSLYVQFKTLMESIILDAKQVDNSRLKSLTEKALQMTALLSINDCITVLPKSNKTMSDKEITDVLESNHTMRRRSMEAVGSPTPAKRSRNKSLFVQSEHDSPRIVNSFSLANEPDPLQIKDTNVTESPEAKKGVGRVTRFSQSPSFNDTYKSFVDETIKATMAADKTRTRERRSGMKKVKELSPKTNTDVTKDMNKEADIKITPTKNESTIETEPTKTKHTPKFKTPKVEFKGSPKIDIVIEDTPRATTPTSVKKIKADFEYEVREQENDCNILILKI